MGRWGKELEELRTVLRGGSFLSRGGNNDGVSDARKKVGDRSPKHRTLARNSMEFQSCQLEPFMGLDISEYGT